MPEPLLINFALAMLTAGCIGLVGAHLKLRSDLSDLRLRVAENYANKGDIAKVEQGMEAMRTKVEAVLQAVYQIQGQLQANSSHGGQ